MADEEIRRWLAGTLEERVQLVDDLVKGSWMRPNVAPAVASAIVRTDARESGDLRLDQTPFHGEIAGAGFEYHDRSPRTRLAGAVEVQAPAAHVDETTW